MLTLLNINRSQKEYLDLLLQYKEYVQAEDLSVPKICALLDEVKCFWLKQLKPIELELEELAENKICFVLSGAIFLDVSSYEHYFFKSFGDCHIISDPFSKFDMIFRFPEEKINVTYTVDYFRRAFFDTLEILTSYNDYFYILPIQEIAVEDSKEHSKLLDMFFWKFISSAFDYEFTSHEEFYTKYKSFEEIESGLNTYVRKNLVFNHLSDRDLSLRERMEKYNDELANISSAISHKSDAKKFLLAVYSYVAQVADILYVSSVLGINPYIRFEITFTYFTIMMNIFTEDENLKKMIEKTLISYVFYMIIDEMKFKNIAFSDYCRQIEDKPLLNSILKKIHTQEINIFNDGISKVAKIIEDTIDTIL